MGLLIVSKRERKKARKKEREKEREKERNRENSVMVENALLHDNIPQRIPQRMILIDELKRSSRIRRARELFSRISTHIPSLSRWKISIPRGHSAPLPSAPAPRRRRRRSPASLARRSWRRRPRLLLWRRLSSCVVPLRVCDAGMCREIC